MRQRAKRQTRAPGRAKSQLVGHWTEIGDLVPRDDGAPRSVRGPQALNIGQRGCERRTGERVGMRRDLGERLLTAAVNIERRKLEKNRSADARLIERQCKN